MTETLTDQEHTNDSQTPENPRALTEYIVLESRSQGTWTELKKVEAANAEYALKALGSAAKEGGSYVAVPTRNWRPARPKVKTTTYIQIEFE